MKKLITIPIILITYIATLAWGPTGHRATGLVAEKYLNKKARKELQRVLGGQSLAMAGTWMDEIRSDTSWNFTADWHWVTIQDGQSYEQGEKNPNGDLILTIEKIITALKSKKLNPKEEVEQLKMLIHLIGDVHQPLHVGSGNDRGGNDVKVSWFRTDSNLHRVWDSDMIDDTRLSFTELAESLEKPDAAKLATWQKTNVRDWANESITYRKDVYNIGDGTLGYLYSYNNFHIVRLRLLQAGVRLAAVLNQIYG